MKKVSFLFLLGLACTASLAQGTGTACKPGFRPDECAVFQKYEKEQADKKSADEARAAKAHAEFEAAQAAEREERARKQQQWTVEREKERAEREARYSAQQAAREQEERTAALEEAQRKARCGADYQKPRVGMTLSRVKECVSDSLDEVGQANTTQGVITTYRTPDGYLRLIGGKVVQWGRL